jgi:hypothetical protein
MAEGQAHQAAVQGVVDRAGSRLDVTANIDAPDCKLLGGLNP